MLLLKLSALTSSLLLAAAQASICVGNDHSVSACFDVKWTDREEATISASVKDTDADSHGVYGSYKIYLDGKAQGEKKFKNNDGYGKPAKKFSKTEYGGGHKITGVRVWACVEDWGSNECTGDKFISYKA